MTNVLISVRTFLLAYPALVTALGAADRVFAVKVPQGTPRPYVVAHQLNDPGHHHLGGRTAIGNPLLQLEPWADDPLQADALADLIEERMDAYRGDMGDLVVLGAFKRDRRGPLATDPMDASDVQRFSVQMDFEIWRAR